jgi:RNA polymerase sigma-70 factor (ECF subfamily)
VHDEQRLAQKRKAEQARAALGELRPSEREALVLRFGGDLSFREVAQACGIDEAAARKRVSRGLAALRSELGEE